MKSRYVLGIITGLDEKIAFLTEYKNITEKMTDSDLDTMAEFLAERQLLIPKIDDKTAEISKIVGKQKKEIQNTLNDILSFKEVECDQEFDEIKVKAKKLESILVDISRLEKSVVKRMDNLKKKLEEEMLKSNKSKQVMDYCSSFASINLNGNKFNSVT